MSEKKPDTWLDNGPEKVPDPNSKKPEDWNDEEDGKWEPPLISNPDCVKFGCGEWKAREIPNPKYKGKWVPPKIKNPLYKGEWKPKQIPNPNYFEDLTPSKFPKMFGIGLELWTMTKNILFDNFLITYDENEAIEYSKKTFLLKNEREKEKIPKNTQNKSDFQAIIKQALDFANQYPVPIFTTLALILISTIVLCCIGVRMFSNDTKNEFKTDLNIEKSEKKELIEEKKKKKLIK